MKFKTTAKAIKANGGTIIALGYCEAQRLLACVSPIAYASGVYGWNFDLYEVDGVKICTGYRGMPGVSVPYALVKEFEDRAENVTWDERRALLSEFVKSATA